MERYQIHMQVKVLFQNTEKKKLSKQVFDDLGDFAEFNGAGIRVFE